MTVPPIEAESYRILARGADLSHLASGPRAVVERVIHASADLEYATTMVVPEHAVHAGVAALVAGAPVVVDVAMVRAGITAVTSACFLGPADDGVQTRSAAAIRRAAAHHPDGAVWVVGCAPTALAEIVGLAAAGQIHPALVVGMPVGFVGAADAKEACRRSGLAAITNVGDKGGSAVAAAVVNALARLADVQHAQR
jgi:precorrin-8X/cobalt-precorrin-8 methylmutase